MKYEPRTETGDCPFCKIGSGELKTPGIYWQDDEFMAFLSIDPNTEGFSCVVPKEHYGSDVMQMPNEVLQRFVLAAKNVCKIIQDTFEDVGRVGVMMEGTGIDHAHIKLSPMHGTEDLKRGEWQQYASGKEFWFDKYQGWICSAGGPKANPDNLKKLADRLKKHA